MPGFFVHLGEPIAQVGSNGLVAAAATTTSDLVGSGISPALLVHVRAVVGSVTMEVVASLFMYTSRRLFPNPATPFLRPRPPAFWFQDFEIKLYTKKEGHLSWGEIENLLGTHFCKLRLIPPSRVTTGCILPHEGCRKVTPPWVSPGSRGRSR